MRQVSFIQLTQCCFDSSAHKERNRSFRRLACSLDAEVNGAKLLLLQADLMNMELAALCLFLTLSSATAFFYSSTDPIDCAWLPWRYMGCARIGHGQYRKRETRGRIEAMFGGRDCSSGRSSRSTESCTAADYITSTIIGAISSTSESQNDVRLGAQGPRGPSLRPDFTDSVSTTPPPFRRNRFSIPERRVCARTFRDPETGIKMLGANCDDRKRRSIDTTQAKSRVKRQFGGNVSSHKHRDILFLLDESGSVGSTNLQKELEFVRTVASRFAYPRDIGRYATRVAVTTFSRNHAHRIEFHDSRDYAAFRRAVDEIKYRSRYAGHTCLIDALRAARNEMFTARKGSRVPSGTADGLLILLTDGCSNCHNGDITQALQTEQKLFESSDIGVLSLMVNVDGRCERSFKALQSGSSCFQGFSYPSWAAFDIMTRKFDNITINRWTKNLKYCP